MTEIKFNVLICYVEAMKTYNAIRAEYAISYQRS